MGPLRKGAGESHTGNHRHSNFKTATNAHVLSRQQSSSIVIFDREGHGEPGIIDLGFEAK